MDNSTDDFSSRAWQSEWQQAIRRRTSESEASAPEMICFFQIFIMLLFLQPSSVKDGKSLLFIRPSLQKWVIFSNDKERTKLHRYLTASKNYCKFYKCLVLWPGLLLTVSTFKVHLKRITTIISLTKIFITHAHTHCISLI